MYISLSLSDRVPIMVVSILVFSIFYFKLFEGLRDNIFLNRMVKTYNLNNFTVAAFFDISLAYLVGFFLYTIIYNSFKFSGTYFNDYSFILSYTNITSIFIVLYTGRIVSYQKGAYYGKLHYTILLAVSTFAITLMINKILLDPIINIGYIIDFNTIFSNINSYLEEIAPAILVIFFLILSLSMFGELLLIGYFSSNSHSILSVVDDISIHPNIIRSDKEYRYFLNKLADLNSVEIKVATNSLAVIRFLIQVIYKYNIKCKLLASTKILCNHNEDPRKLTILEIFREHILELPNDSVDQSKKDFDYMLSKMGELEKIGFLELRDYFYGDTTYIIFKYKTNCKKMLISVRRKNGIGVTDNMLGLFTGDPIIINIMENAFNTTWENSRSILSNEYDKRKLNHTQPSESNEFQRPCWWEK